MPTWLGCPLQILTDQGPNFESNLFQQLCRLMCVDKIRTTPYKPSTNGNIERFHGTMHSMLAKLVSENQRDWDEKLPAVAFAYHLLYRRPHDSRSTSSYTGAKPASPPISPTALRPRSRDLPTPSNS